MNNNIFFILVFFVFSLSGCKDETKSTDWYREHLSEMQKTYDECKKTGEESDNCANAKEAHFQIQQKNAPTLKFHD